MKNIEFAVKQKKMMDCLQRMAQVVKENSMVPITSHVLIDVMDSHMEVSATNLNSWETNRVELEMTAGDPGKFTVNCKKLISIIANMPADDFVSFAVKVDNASAKIVVKWNKSKFTLNGHFGDEFPDVALDCNNIQASFYIPGTTLGDYLGGVSHAASLDATRFALNSVLMELVSDNRVDVVATDTHRLIRDIMITQNMNTKDNTYGQRFLLPLYSVNEIVRMFGKDPGECTVEFSSNACVVTGFSGTLVYHTRLLVGKYPNYNKLFTSTENVWSMLVQTKDVITAIKRVSAVSSGKITALTFRPFEDMMQVSVQDEESHEIAVDLFAYEGDKGHVPFDAIGFNLKYTLEMLNSMRSDKVRLYVVDHESPMLTVSLQRDIKYLNMPMRLS